jgi:hypothetical protein
MNLNARRDILTSKGGKNMHYSIITASETKERSPYRTVRNIATDDMAGLMRVLSYDIDMEGGDDLRILRLNEAGQEKREDWAAAIDEEGLVH